MKQYISRTLKIIALGYLGFPVIYFFWLLVIFDIPGMQGVRILLSPLFYIACAGAIFSGWGLWEMKRFAWYLLLGTNIFVCYLNALFINEYSVSHYKGPLWAVTAFFLVTVLLRISREVRVPYFFPKIRWWESDPRYKLSVPVQFKTEGMEAALEGQILDLSNGGCFIKLRGPVKEHDVLSLEFTVFGTVLTITGHIVWKTESTVTHPSGVGVKFFELEKEPRRHLKLITKRLKQIATFYRKSRYLLNQEDFLSKLEELEGPLEAPKLVDQKKA